MLTNKIFNASALPQEDLLRHLVKHLRKQDTI